MGAVLIGKCDICGKRTNLDVTYFCYNIKCECCSPRHFVRVEHCKDCIPEIPKEVKIITNHFSGGTIEMKLTDVKPDEIRGDYKEI